MLLSYLRLLVLTNKCLLLILLSFLIHNFCLSQSKKINTWAFGYYAGLDFNQQAPTPFESAVGEVNATSCMSDDQGNLLFYTDGSRVWNRAHQIMPNGSGLDAQDGNFSQQVIIVPKPRSSHHYYIFTISDYSWYDNLLHNNLLYHEVSFSSNPYGEVISKNNRISHERLLSVKITAVHHANGEDVWLLTQSALSGNFYIHLVTEHGINVPIIAEQPTVDKSFGSGQMKFSPDGTKVAVANSFNRMLLYKFDTQTGILTDRLLMNYTQEAGGIEFSKDSKLLYEVTRTGYCFPGRSYLKQYDCSLWDLDKIKSSALIIASGADNYGMLQLAPDGKIYIGGLTGGCDPNTYLDIIEHPTIKGINCHFIEDGIWLGGKTTSLGLPNFIQSYLIPPCPSSVNLIPDQSICSNQSLTLDAGTWQAYKWSTGQTIRSIQVDKAGIYWVEVTEDQCLRRDTIEIKYVGIDDLVVSASSNQIAYGQTIVFSANGSNIQKWVWNFDDGEQAATSTAEHLYGQAGQYKVTLEAINIEGCTATETLEIRVDPYLPNVFTPNGDGVNDLFEVKYKGAENFHLTVCDRLGRQVYGSTGKNIIHWSGEGHTNGLYYYGLVIGNKKYNGWLHLLR